MAVFPIDAYSRQDLENQSTPAAVPGGNLEAYPQVLYDTQTYVAAGSATLEYFGTTNVDKSLNNMKAGGQLPDPEYFRIFWIQIVPIIGLSDAAAPLAWSDMSQLLVVGRGTFEFNAQDKSYGRVPLINAPSPGGIAGFGYAEAATAGAEAHEYSNNGAPTGGWWIGGAILLKPKVNFGVTLRFVPATAVSADRLIRVQLVGVGYRAIV